MATSRPLGPVPQSGWWRLLVVMVVVVVVVLGGLAGLPPGGDAPASAFGSTPARVRAQEVGPWLYVAVAESNRLVAIDLETGTVQRSWRVGAAPFALVRNPTRPLLHVATLAGLTTFDPTTGQIVGHIAARLLGNWPTQVAVDPTGRRLYVQGVTERQADTETYGVLVFDLEQQRLANPVGDGGQAVAVHPDGSRLYVSGGGVVQAIASEGHRLLAEADLRPQHTARALGVAPSGDRIYVAGTAGVEVLDAITLRPVGQILLPRTQMALALAQDQSRLYTLSNREEGDGIDEVTVMDPRAALVLTRFPVGGAPYSLALDDRGDRLFVANSLSNTVSIIDTTSYRELLEIPVGQRPVALAFQP
jgi:YVTN family beta-propeller protein